MIYRFLRLIKYYLVYSFRSRSFVFMALLNVFISILILLVMSSSGTLLKSFVPGNIKQIELPTFLRERVYNFQWANILIYIPILSAAFFGSTAIPYEYERGTIYNLYSLPITRLQFVLSRVMGATILSFLSTLIIVGFQFFSVAIYFRRMPDDTFVFYVLLLLLVTFSDVTMAVAISTFFKNSGHSAIAFLIVYLVIFNIFSLVGTDAGIIPAIFIKTNADRVLYGIFLNSDPYFLTYSFSLSPLPENTILFISSILLFYSFTSILIAYGVTMLRREYR